MSFHTIGDSHAAAGWVRLSSVQTHCVGAWTAYAIGRDGLNRLNIEDIVKPGDSACFCFGEIDCRAHVHKHVDETDRPAWVIGRIVADYLHVIHRNMQLVGNLSGYLYSVPPAARSASSVVGSDYPFLGTDSDRAAYVTMFNDMQFHHGAFYGFRPIDVWHKYADSNGLLDRRFSTDGVHIHDPIHLREALTCYGL